MTRQTVYISHPVGSPMDERFIKKIKEAFPLCDFKIAEKERGENLLKTFKKCQTAIFLPFGDGRFCATERAEAICFVKEGRTIWQINPYSGRICQLKLKEMKTLSVKETLKRLQ